MSIYSRFYLLSCQGTQGTLAETQGESAIYDNLHQTVLGCLDTKGTPIKSASKENTS